MLIRPLSLGDSAWVVALNAANEIETSPIDSAWLEAMAQQWFCAWVSEQRDAFAIVFDHTAAYGSPNFRWFQERFARFAYVDRIVVSASARGQGIARTLYDAVFRDAARAGYDRIVCEVNVDPPNLASDAFHERLGFAEIGRAALANGKTVRYLERFAP